MEKQENEVEEEELEEEEEELEEFKEGEEVGTEHKLDEVVEEVKIISELLLNHLRRTNIKESLKFPS